MNKSIEVVALGTCYVDTNVADYPFSEAGIPPEVELVGGDYEVAPGGSAVNFCRMLGGMGLKSAFIGMTGEDSNADLLHSLLQQESVRPELVRKAGLATNIGFNMTNAHGQHIMLVAGTANAALTPEVVLPKLQKTLSEAELLYLGGCFKLKAFTRSFSEIARLTRSQEAKLVVDHGRISGSISPEMKQAVKDLVLKADYYLPSREEFCQLWEVNNIEEGLQLLVDQAPRLIVVVKDGANGAYYYDDSVRHVAAEKVDKVAEVTGAGDSFNAGVLAGVLRHHSLSSSVAYGCSVAAAKITKQPIPSL